MITCFTRILEKKLKCVKEDKKGAEDQKMAPKVKKKKMKINLHQPLGTRLKFDEDGDTIPPLAAAKSGDDMLQLDKGFTQLHHCHYYLFKQLRAFNMNFIEVSFG